MRTMSEIIESSENEFEGLEVCKKCGWHRLMHHDCHPKAGVRAKKLIAKANALGVSGTQLGYGQLAVALSFDKDTTLVLRADTHSDSFEFDHLFGSSLSEETVLAMVKALGGR